MMRKQEKRWIAAMLAVLAMLLCGAALGSQVTEAEYANAPANPTQDNVTEIRALLQKAAGEENYPLSLLYFKLFFINLYEVIVSSND